MAVIVTGSNPVINGTGNADIIFQASNAEDPITINGGGGNDVVLGNRGGFFSSVGGGDTLATAFSLDSPVFWNRLGNALVDDDTVPYASVLATGTNALIYYTVTVGAGQQLTADVDFAFGGFGGPSWDTRVQLLAGDGTTVLRDSDDSNDTDGGLGSIGNAPASTQDSYLQYTNSTAAAVTLYLVVGRYEFDAAAPLPIPAGNAFLMNVSVGGHADSGGGPAQDLTLNGGKGDDFLLGNLGDDTIVGGIGNDRLYGGAGNDRFVWNQGHGSDTIDGGVGTDTLDLRGATSGWGVNLLTGAAGNGADALALTGIDTVIGTDFDDVLTSRGTGTTIEGGDGDDLVYANNGAPETLNGGGGTDTLDVTSYTDANGFYVIELVSGATNFGEAFTGFENVVSGQSNDTITGTGDANTIRTQAGDDTVNAGEGNDVVLGGTGTNTLNGGGGFDTVSYADAELGVDVRLALQGTQQDTGVGADTLSGFEALVGSDFADALYGDAFDNRLTGGLGNDTLEGGGGADVFVIRTGDGSDTIDGGDGTDTLDLTNATEGWFVNLAQERASGGTDVLSTLRGIEIVLGTGETDVLFARFGETLHGRGGDDAIVASNFVGGVLDGGAGVDIIDLSAFDFAGFVYTINLRTGTTDQGEIITNFENLITGNTADRVTGTSVANDISTGEGDDTISAGGGNDTIVAGVGKDMLDGGTGADTLRGGDGDDTYVVDNVGDSVVEQADEGTDLVLARIDYVLGAALERLTLTGTARSGTGNALDNAIRGTIGGDILAGLDGNDNLTGGAGNDRLIGGAGNDLLTGGMARDELTGGTGTDRFTFFDGNSSADRQFADRILDFSRAEGDKIVLRSVDANSNLADDQNFTFIGSSAFHNVAGELHVVTTSAFTYAEGDVNGDGVADFAIRLTGTVALEAGDFVL